MTDVFVYDAVRTPRGRGKKDGSLHEVPAVRLGAKVLESLRDRNGLDTGTVDDIIFGCVDPVGEAGSVIPRASAFEAGYDMRAPGIQISRFCASGLDAINFGAAKIAQGADDIVIAGGVESMSRVGMGMSGGAWFMDPSVGLPGYFVPQGVSADLIATKYGFCATMSTPMRSRARSARPTPGKRATSRSPSSRSRTRTASPSSIMMSICGRRQTCRRWPRSIPHSPCRAKWVASPL